MQNPEPRDAPESDAYPARDDATTPEALAVSVELPPKETKKRKKSKIKFASPMARNEAVAYFSALVDGIRHGQLQFKQNDESLCLQPASQVNIEVKASQKGDREKVSFELSWQATAAGDLTD